MRYLLLSAFALMTSGLAKGQNAAQYLFSSHTGTYTNITGGTSVAAIETDDANVNGINIGFGFNYCGVSYNSVAVGSNGWMSFVTPNNNVLTNSAANITTYLGPSVFPLWDDLDGDVGTAWYATTGSAPNRVFTFEWRDWLWNYAATVATISMQVKLYETTNVIEFIYRQESGPVNAPTGSVGIGKTQTDYLTLSNTSIVPFASSTTFTENISSRPNTGQVYRFTPPTISCSGTPVAGTAHASVTNACPSTPFTVGLVGNSVGTGLNYQWQSRLGTSGPWTNIAGATGSAYIIANQTASSQYRAYVICTNGNASDTSTVVTVTQGTPAQCVCVPTYTNGGAADYIANVVLGTLSHNTGASANPAPYYRDYTTLQPATLAIPSLTEGSSYNLSITFGGDPNQYNGVWVDFNQDGVFATTEFFSSNTNTGANGTVIVPIAVPMGALGGNARMRIRGADDSQPSSNQACGASNSTYGEAEDYLVNIVPLCTMPSGLTATGITGTTANLSWGAVTGSAGYQVVVNTSSTPPASGAAQSGTTYNATGLIPGTTYYLHVRNNCGSSFSMWATYSFNTICPVPTGVAASNIGVASADFNWNAVPGVITGYEYAINTSATPPASGAAIATNSYNAILLTPSTSYYFHVRTQCNATTFSPWVSIPFTTQSPTCFSPTGLTATGITPTGATLNWNAVSSGSTGYEWAVTTSQIPPASGALTANTTTPSGTLIPGTTYYAHVRNICSPTLNSIWTTITFNTPYLPCLAPNVSISNITVGGLTISWAAVNTAVGYEYAIDTSLTAPNSGTTTTNLTESIAGLIDETNYVLHVRTNCGPGGFSPWVNIPFATAAYCTAPTAIFSNITESKADINWNAMSGAVSYEYVVSTNIVPPTAGTVTTGLNHNADHLEPFTQYYVHLRSTCANDISNWSTSGFVTLAPVSVSHANGTAAGITVYPNPVKHMLTVKINGNANSQGQLQLTDITGRVLITYEVKTTEQQIDMSQLSAGVYMLRYADENGVSTIRVTKE